MRTRSTITKLAAGAGLTGALVLASFGVAGAATNQPATTKVNCTQAAKRLPKIEAAQADLHQDAGQVAGWVSQAQQGGLTRLAKRFGELENRLNNTSNRLQKREQRIEAACPGIGGSSS
jgi:hypothetical protein